MFSFPTLLYNQRLSILVVENNSLIGNVIKNTAL